MNDMREIPWKRLLVEAAAIVASILLAFAIDAWWQDHSDQARLEEYLLQVHADSLDNQHRLTEAIQLEKGQQRAVQEILAALRSPVPMTIDSARQWTQLEPGFIWYSDPRLLEKSITTRIWYLEQMLAATEELSNQLNIRSNL